MSIKITEAAPGNLNIVCQVSGMPIARTTVMGMFCNAAVCECEQKSAVVTNELGLTDFLNNIMNPNTASHHDFLEDLMSPEAEADLEEQCKLCFYEKGLE